jgi:hypothetical protein
MGLVNEIETALRGTGLDPARVMAAADLNRMPIKTAVGLLKVPQLLAELGRLNAQAPLDAAGVESQKNLLQQFESEALKCRDHVQQRALQTRVDTDATPLARLSHRDVMRRLGDAHAWLPTALDSLTLDWAQDLTNKIDTLANEIRTRGNGVGEDATRQIDAQMMLREAQAELEAERLKRGAGSNPAGASNVVGQDWLERPDKQATPTEAEQTSVVGLLQHYQVPEQYWGDWQRLLWNDMRAIAKTELALFREEGQPPVDVASQRYTRQDAVNRLSSTQGYVNYLMGDAAAYRRVADVNLNAQLSYDRLANEAHNGGVLREPQLQALQNETDAHRKAQMAEIAFRAYRISGRRDWAGFMETPNRPVYRDFANYLSTEGGRSTFDGILNSTQFEKDARAFVYQANVLDFIGLTEQRLGLNPGADPANTASPLGLRQARDQVNAQLALISERRLPASQNAEQALNDQARKLLTYLKTKIEHALNTRR